MIDNLLSNLSFLSTGLSVISGLFSIICLIAFVVAFVALILGPFLMILINRLRPEPSPIPLAKVKKL